MNQMPNMPHIPNVPQIPRPFLMPIPDIPA